MHFISDCVAFKTQTVLFSSVHLQLTLMRSGKSTLSSLSAVSLVLALPLCQCCFGSGWHFLFRHLFSPGSLWCDVLGLYLYLNLLNASDPPRRKAFMMVALPGSLSTQDVKVRELTNCAFISSFCPACNDRRYGTNRMVPLSVPLMVPCVTPCPVLRSV